MSANTWKHDWLIDELHYSTMYNREICTFKPMFIC